MINWPTAMVLTAAILGGGFLYSSQGSANWDKNYAESVTAINLNDKNFIHFHGKRLRHCYKALSTDIHKVECGEWQ